MTLDETSMKTWKHERTEREREREGEKGGRERECVCTRQIKSKRD